MAALKNLLLRAELDSQQVNQMCQTQSSRTLNPVRYFRKVKGQRFSYGSSCLKWKNQPSTVFQLYFGMQFLQWKVSIRQFGGLLGFQLES